MLDTNLASTGHGDSVRFGRQARYLGINVQRELLVSFAPGLIPDVVLIRSPRRAGNIVLAREDGAVVDWEANFERNLPGIWWWAAGRDRGK